MSEPCNRTGCGEAAKWAPKVFFPVKGILSDNSPTSGILGLKLCDIHIKQVFVKDLKGMGIEALIEQLMPGMEVDWDRVYLGKVDIESEEFKAWEK